MTGNDLRMLKLPNVLLICVDHLAGLLTRPAGHPVVMTPTLAQLARNGCHFTNTYSACPVCIPARRSLMTGMTARGHGDRTFSGDPMPDATTLAQAFGDAGYQAFAVGKLHVNPQRNRIGFHEVILNEEGRCRPNGFSDDWELYLAEHGHAGEEFACGLCNNDYMTRTWHLPEHCHPTNWAAAQMCRMIHRRDPRKPAFWYLSFSGPHPPIWPLATYMDQYRTVPMDPPVIGEWAQQPANLPWLLRQRLTRYSICDATPHEVDLARRAFYGLITHIDHQIRVVIGTLREAGLLDDTIIAITSDHGDMLGDHRQWAKGLMYEMSAKVPLIVVPAVGDDRLACGSRDERLAELRDVMPTLLDLAGLDIPDTVEGMSLVGRARREHLYGEIYQNDLATRMIRDERFKLIYYPVGNRRQLFDLEADPREACDLADDATHRQELMRLEKVLIEHLYGSDEAMVRGGKLVGVPEKPDQPMRDRGLFGQRGLRFM